MPVSRPYDPAHYTTLADVLALGAKLEDRIEKLEGVIVVKNKRIEELEDAMREIQARLRGAHDGSVVLPMREIVNRALEQLPDVK